MSYRTKLKIGEFSQMMQVTVKTLRYYEQKGLLIPNEVDEWTGYRYYTIEQMQKLNNIRNLQQLGFSLDEIKELYEEDTHYPSLRQLNAKIKETNHLLQTLAEAGQNCFTGETPLKKSRQWTNFLFNHCQKSSWQVIVK